MEDKKYICEKCETEFKYQSNYCRHKKKNTCEQPSNLAMENKILQFEMEKMQLENKLLQTELKLLQTENKLVKEEESYKKLMESENFNHEMMRTFIHDLVKDLEYKDKIIKDLKNPEI